MIDVPEIQTSLREFQLDGWLLYDFRGSNLLARRVLKFPDEQVGSRRWFYFIPVEGEPRKLVHQIEAAALDHLPGNKQIYLSWQELEAGLTRLVSGAHQVAMEYSPRAGNPYISRVDAGTIELVQSNGINVLPSGDLIQQFEATWDAEQWQLHQTAAQHTDAAFALAWSAIAHATRTGEQITEVDVQQRIMRHFQDCGMTTYHPPIVAVGPHSGDPHFAPQAEQDTPIKENDFVLIDLWAKMDQPRGVYSDLTRVACVASNVPEKYEHVFQIVARARDAAIQRVRDAFAEGNPLAGWEVDQAARDVIHAAGYGEYFIHRTGHSIGQETHGNGANMDNLEMRDERRVLRNTCFSVEPGIYLPEFGIRSEVNVFVDSRGQVHVTGGLLQQNVLALLAP